MEEGAMNEPTIICPKCSTEIKLTESLAAPLVAAIKQEYKEKLSAKETALAMAGGTINSPGHFG